MQKFKWLACLMTFVIINAQAAFSQTETLSTGSFIVNMGVTPQTIGNGLKPYGLVYDLVRNYSVPVRWVIGQGKAKDGVDFSYNGTQFKGGTFIIPAEYRTAAVNSRITYWTGQGVVGVTTTSSLSVNVTNVIKAFPRWTLDATNGAIAQGYLTNAGITLTAFPNAYNWKTPATLDCCDDFYVMPHADPTWATHGNLYNWNKNCLGSIWAACHAVSALENSINPSNTTQQMNFLSTRTSAVSPTPWPNNSLTLFSSHSGGSIPYTHQNFDDPIAQYMGVTDLAQLNGSEQIYLPKQDASPNNTRWRPGSKIIAYDPTQLNVLNPDLANGNVAALIVYGRAFDDPARGYVMYEAGHSHNKGTAGDVAAQRAFLNFSFFQIQPKAPAITTTGITTGQNINSGTAVPVSASASSPLVGVTFTYLWSSSCGGTFANATAASTTFTAPTVSSPTPCTVTCQVSDNCGRTSFLSYPITILSGPQPPVANRDSATINLTCGVGTSVTTNVLANDTDPGGLPLTLTNVTGALNGTMSFTAAGNVTFTPSANFTGPMTLTYTVCNNATPTALCSTGQYKISTTGVAAPSVANDSYTILEDSISRFNVLANDASGLTVMGITSGPSNGKVSINIDNTITYLPNADFKGTDNFTYKVVNASGGVNTATVTVTITPDACSAGSYQAGSGSSGSYSQNPTKDSYLSQQNTTQSFGGKNIISVDGQSAKALRGLLQFDLSSVPSNATISNVNLKLVATAAKTTTAFDVALHRVTNLWEEGNGNGGPGSVGILANWTTRATGPLTWTTAGGDFNATAEATTSVSATGTYNWTGGTMNSLIQKWVNGTNTNNGMLLKFITENTGDEHKDFGSRENATSGNRPLLTFDWSTPAPCSTIPARAPLSMPDSASTVNGVAVNIATATNDYYPVSGSKTYTIVSAPLSGTATINGTTGVVNYTPATTFNGVRSLTYRVLDNTSGLADTATVYINITDAPVVANNDSPAGALSGTAQTVNVLSNDTDPDVASLTSPTYTVSIASQPKNGTVTVNGSGSIVYTPNAGFTGKDTLTYNVCEPTPSCGSPNCATAYLYLTVINRAPTAVNDTKTILPCLSNTIDLIGNDTDPENGLLTVGNVSALSNPSAGSLVNNNDGTVTFTPATGFSGTVTFTYTVRDNGVTPLTSPSATVSITVSSPVNTAPLANTDVETLNMDEVDYFSVLDNDTDPESNTLTNPTITVQPLHGTATVLANGLIKYIPNPGYYGKDTLTYQICDIINNPATCSTSQDKCDTARLYYTILVPNTVVAVSDENSTWVNTPVSGSLLDNDFDPEGDTPIQFNGFIIGGVSYTSGTITVSGVDASGNPVANAGTLLINADGTYTYTPANNFIGSINVPYSIQDGNPNTAYDTAYLHITVNPLPAVSNSVIANNDEYKTPINVNVNSNVITSNDYDPQGDAFTVTSYTFDSDGNGTQDGTGTMGSVITIGGVTTTGVPVSNAGTLVLNADGSFTFNPQDDFTGSVDVVYTITDANGATSTAILHIEIVPDVNGPLNDPPKAGDDFSYTPYNTPVNGNFSSNDKDPNGNPISYGGITINPAGPATPIGAPVTTEQGGTIQFYANGTYLYTPPTNYTGPDKVNYSICDVTAIAPQPLCGNAIIHLLVGPINTTNAINDENSTWQDVNVSGNVMSNDYDTEGNTQTFGSFLNQSTNTPITSGATVSGVSSTGAPVANAGILSFDANGNYTFDPDPAFTGTVSIPYKVCDNGIPTKCDTAYLIITVSPLPSVANTVIANNDENISYGNPVSNNVLLNDADPQGDNFTVTSVSGGTVGSSFTVSGVDQNGNPVANAGTLVINSNGTYTYTPAAGFTGSISVPYTITDNNGSPATSTAILHIDVLADSNGPLNDPPFAGDDFSYTEINTPVNGNFIGNDSDPNGNPISLNGTTIVPGGPHTPIGSPVTTAQGGTVQFYADGTYTYTPPKDYVGPDGIEYTICDVTSVNPNPLCNVAYMHFLVGPANTTNATNDENSTWQDVNVSGNVLTNDFDIEKNIQTFGSFLNQVTNAPITSGATVSGVSSTGTPVANAGTLSFGANGSYTFDPDPAFIGTVTIPYNVCDNGNPSKCDTAYLTITVSPLPSTANSVIANNDENTSYGSPVSNNVLLNDADPQKDNFTVTSVSGGSVGSSFTVSGVDPKGNPVANAGTLIINADGSYTYTPASGFTGSIDVPYTITDNNASPASATAILHINVIADPNGPLNDPPIAGDDFAYTHINTPVNGNYVGNDSDPNSNPVSLNGTTIVPGGPHTPIGSPVPTQHGGTVQFYADGTYTYTPPTDYSGPDSCGYTICDVTSVNPNPLCNVAFMHFLIDPAAPLPVTLTRFTALLLNSNQSKLSWVSESEINCNRYEIERSNNGLNFALRGSVTATGNPSSTQGYSFIDELNTSASVIYYRLRMVDNDGSYKYSNIVSLRRNDSYADNNLKVYPNPFVSNVRIELNSQQYEKANINIHAVDGRVIYRRDVQLQIGANVFTLPDLGSYPGSTYMLEIKSNSLRIIKKIMKNQ